MRYIEDILLETVPSRAVPDTTVADIAAICAAVLDNTVSKMEAALMSTFSNDGYSQQSAAFESGVYLW